MRAAALALILLLAACSGESDAEQTLSSLQIRQRLGGHTLTGTENGRRFNITLSRGGIGRYIDEEIAEFVPWSTDDGKLCLQWRDRPETCELLVQIGVAHYRWDGFLLSDLDLGLQRPLIRPRM